MEVAGSELVSIQNVNHAFFPGLNQNVREMNPADRAATERRPNPSLCHCCPGLLVLWCEVIELGQYLVGGAQFQ